MSGPWEKYAAPASSQEPSTPGPWNKYGSAEPATTAAASGVTLAARGAAPPAVGTIQGFGMGVLRGAKDVVDSGAQALSSGFDMLTGSREGDRVAAMNAAGKVDFEKGFGDSTAASVGRVGGQIAATLPVGGFLGAGVKAVGAAGLAPGALVPLGEAIATGGFRAAGAGPFTRAVGGAVSGGAIAGLTDPDAAGTGAVIGAALPPVVQGLGKVAGAAGKSLHAAMLPDSAKAAGAILRAAGAETLEDIGAIRGALRTQGPNIVGEAPTVAQILQNPGVSQLSRTLRNAGETSLLEREQLQDAARLAVLDRVSPVTGTVQQSADNFGNALSPRVRVADADARAATSRAFDAVDPFDETALRVPIGPMQQAQQRFIGPGSFGTGQRSQAAIEAARTIGEIDVPAIAAGRGGANRQQDLMQAIRQAGGINRLAGSSRMFAGELQDLSQSGGRGLMTGGRGQSLDRLAERMHEAGFIQDPDPVTLMNALRASTQGERILANTADEGRAFRGRLESAQGEAPGAATMPTTAPFRQVQNLRSSIGEAADAAAAKGSMKEAAALRTMLDEIDSSVERAAAGAGHADEFFPADMVKQWKEARRLKADQMERFRTGPQASIFQRGGDGEALAQGGELAPKFFSPRLSQADDIGAFGRIADPETSAALKNYAVTDLANQTDRLGRLTNAKVNTWVDRRSGALEGLLDDGERAQVNGVARDLDRADRAASLGLATGSATAQNVQSAMSLGLLDNPALNAIASRTPLIGRVASPFLDAIKGHAKRAKIEQLSGLLSDPDVLDAALERYLAARPTGPLQRQLSDATEVASPLLYRSAPLSASSP